MIERYTLPEMGAIWSEQAKFQSWLDVEIAATEANCELGRVPAEAVATIQQKASFSVERILEIEAEVRHDVIAFLTNVNEHVGDAGRYIHVGMTSSDVLDTGVALQMKASVQLLRQELDKLANALRELARAHKGTVMIGRSHAIHGEPITFGFKVAGWLAEVVRNQERLERLERVVSVGQISGAMGTYANTDPRVEAIACAKLGLVPDTASTQVIARDRHAEYVQTLALVGAALERFSTEIRNLQRTDVLEVHATLLGLERVGDAEFAGVEFSGWMREAADRPALTAGCQESGRRSAGGAGGCSFFGFPTNAATNWPITYSIMGVVTSSSMISGEMPIASNGSTSRQRTSMY